MSQSEKTANAVGAKTARACDSCIRRRARWYCAADDAFLCQACDSSVHSANPLAQRHDRVRLKTASSSTSLSATPDLVSSALPTWHQGFTRKARTPRHHAKSSSLAQSKPPPALLVPDLEDQPEAEEEEEEELLYRVPIFNPILSEFCSPLIDDAKPVTKPVAVANDCLGYGFSGPISPSDIELAEFAADVESLFGTGLDDGSFCIDALGLMDVRGEGEEDMSQVKMEMDDVSNMVGRPEGGDMDRMEFSSESLDINFDCGSPEVEEKKAEVAPGGIGLRIDYEAVIADWSSRGCSPWTDGKGPQFGADDCLPDFMGVWGGDAQGCYGGHAAVVDGEREARVMRYREKRRTRLFSKKIRYEVRKLNAEKRPRMKGRFVKRAASFTAPAGVPAGFAY